MTEVSIVATLSKVVQANGKPTQFLFESTDNRLFALCIGEIDMLQEKPVDLSFAVRLTAEENAQRELPHTDPRRPLDYGTHGEICYCFQCGAPLGVEPFETDSGKLFCNADHAADYLLAALEALLGPDLFGTLQAGDKLRYTDQDGQSRTIIVSDPNETRDEWQAGGIVNCVVESTGECLMLTRDEVNHLCTYRLEETITDDTEEIDESQTLDAQTLEPDACDEPAADEPGPDTRAADEGRDAAIPVSPTSDDSNGLERVAEIGTDGLTPGPGLIFETVKHKRASATYVVVDVSAEDERITLEPDGGGENVTITFKQLKDYEKAEARDKNTD